MEVSILEPEDMPQFNNAKVAVFTQNTVNVVDGHQVADGIITHTLWGELAWQLGGREAYELVRNDDTQMIAPNAQKFKTILEKASPALILIDELADYCNKASGKIVGSGTLFTQTNSFIQALTEVVSSVPKTVLICTLPASAREVASSEIGQEILSSFEKTQNLLVFCSFNRNFELIIYVKIWIYRERYCSFWTIIRCRRAMR